MNLVMPFAKPSIVTVLWSICVSMSEYLTIGPAISCGKSETNIRKFMKDFCALTSPL